jgi:uncharacterized protein (TIGR03437 family)
VSRHPNRIPRIFTAISLALLTLGAVVCLAIDVGSGAPTAGLTQKFVNAFFRNGFAYIVALPPVSNVQRFGTTGLIQEFRELSGTGRLALVKANQTLALPTDGSVDVAQVLAKVYGYYSTVGVNTAGYPTVDTLTCPPVSTNTCTYQFFNKNYVLFVYDSATFTGQNFALRDPFYTRWVALGGIGGPGPVTDVETNVTVNAVNATVQTYANAALYNITSGTLNGRLIGVSAPVYAAYIRAGGHDGYLGLPTSEDIVLTGGGHRQSFQGGNLDYNIGSDPVLRLPVDSVSIIPYNTSPIQMVLGDTLPFHVNLYTASGVSLTDRTVTWITTNNRVVAIDAAAGSPSAVARAVGAGSAVISAVSEGKLSPTVQITVTSPCCQIGEGSPTPIIQQAIQDAVTRNRLTISLPAKSLVQRIGLGYTQELFSTGSPAVRYLIAKPDSSPSAYVVSGDYLLRYDQLGGPSGSLGYPVSDGPPGGHQLFTYTAALASIPPRLVSGAILAKWTALNFESGPAGAPTGEATSVVASSSNRATQQTFAKGLIIAASTGPKAGQAQLVTSLILDRYNALGGAGSALGLPIGDEFGLDGRRHQDFEGGYIDYGPGDSTALEHGAARRPSVSSTPSSAVVAGSRLRLSITGFADQSTLRVSITDQADFVVSALNGAYSWETYVPLSAPSKTFAIHAVDTAAGTSADGAYTVKSLAESRLQLVKTQGDAQTAAPGARLTQTLRVQLVDENGTPVIGVPVTFAASTGGQILPAAALTDDSGQAEAAVRLPAAVGLALVTAEAARLVTTFSARAVAAALPNFPAFLQSAASYGNNTLGKGSATIAQKGALLTAAAGIVRYYQNRGELSGPPADPGSLNQFLQNACAVDADGAQVCDGFLGDPSGEQVVNLWRIGALTGGRLDVSVETPDLAAVRDLVSQGAPVLLALSLTANGAPAGGHYVVATGVAGDGAVLISDPNPDFGRSNLNDYLAGFPAGGQIWQAKLGAVVRFVPRAPSATGFLIAAISQPAASIQQIALDLASIAGPCGRTVDFGDAAALAAPAPLVSRFRYCDGAQGVYQLSLGQSSTAAPQAYRATLTDLAPGGRRIDVSGGGGPAAFKLARPGIQLAVAPQDVNLTPGGVVNPASWAPGIAPGGLMSILGSGLAGAGADTAVDVNGVAATVVFQSPFRLDVQVPPDLAPGTYPVQVRSPFGTATQSVDVWVSAPAIFAKGVANQDSVPNSPITPARRGQELTIYCTGLGAVIASGDQFQTQAGVSGILNGAAIQPDFAGWTPGFVGLYQVDLPIPAATPPGIDLPLLLRQFDRDSNTVFVAIQ